MIADIIQYEFLRNALLAGLLSSVICGMIGSYIVVRKIVFMSGGIAHSAFGGIGLGYYLGFDPLWGAFGFSVISAFSIGAARRYGGQSEDTIIGILWAVGMALGILFISLSPGYAPDLFSYLFGNILTVPLSDIYVMLALNAVVITIVAVFYNDIMAVSFDEEFSRVLSRPVNFIYFMMLVLVGITVVMIIKIVGIILVISLMTIPPAISLNYSRRLSTMMAISSLVGALFTLTGLYLSYEYDLQSGATIILVSAVGYVITIIAKYISRRSSR